MPNLTHLDLVPLLPDLLSHASLTVRLGIWQPETGQQFPAENSVLPLDTAGRLIIEPVN